MPGGAGGASLIGMRMLLPAAVLLSLLGCATARPASDSNTAPTRATAAADATNAIDATATDTDAAAKDGADARRAPNDGRRASAEEYRREVMQRARRRGVQVIWVKAPRGEGYILDRRPPTPMGFQPY